MGKLKTLFTCESCGYESLRWLGKCPTCGAWNCFSESIADRSPNNTMPDTTISGKLNMPVTLKNITNDSEHRIKTHINELDMVLSGGIVQGSLMLIGGDPGIGKSTLLLQICQKIGEDGNIILYVSGEESVAQIKLRANRLGIITDNLLLLSETNITYIEDVIRKKQPKILIIDSIQTIYNNDISSAPGSVTQVRECTSILMRISKGLNISIIIVGHVTKEGALAGPRILEHMVDTVLYFEGDRQLSYRILRSVKNRFGSTNEIGVFEMQDKGLVEITNPSEYMLAGRPINVSGSAITCSMEGSRPILAEVQALVSFSNFGMPRRMAQGFDYNRTVLLIAVLEKRAGLQLGSYDCYVNIAGGLKIVEPALDSAVLISIASSYKNRPIDSNTIIFGEVGLTGEIRAVAQAEKRITEALKLGFKLCYIPALNLKNIKAMEGIKIIGVSNIIELIDKVF